MTNFTSIASFESALNILRHKLVDQYTDYDFERQSILSRPAEFSPVYDVNVCLNVRYGYGEVDYKMAVVYTWGRWRYVRVYDLTTKTLYRHLMNYLYLFYDGEFAHTGNEKPYAKGNWNDGFFARYYHLDQTFDLPSWN